ncbi:FecCD family ABC transporter permease [Dethiosulfovibrio salsuginis]|uniref:Iron complex transport system permease protein n=1 Tax=Dethiosulfovibrio salsuginis TaxID=561720 RepID=A0A1X7KE64_9BACT|nr:iron ABC transporter permease [Dethiosulfovibrio salsuginis]SMG39371.1 iron complex transport system permease protein [Dethiosulfovibrio salsuginis]
MHLDRAEVSLSYRRHVERKQVFMVCLFLIGVVFFCVSLSVGVSGMPLDMVLKGLLGMTEGRDRLILWSIRMPQAVAAVAAGAGLALSGAAMQAILRNPLGSPFTLGFSHAGAFGAALTVMVLAKISPVLPAWLVSFGPGIVALGAFVFCMIATSVILAVSAYRGASPETMVLCGVALGSLFTAGTMFLQYFADDVQLAAMVFWTFGDLARAGWKDLGVMASVLIPGGIYFYLKRWDFNAVEAGDETARGLGVDVSSLRLTGLVVSSLMVSVTVAYLGVIGFVGLICPHFIRRILGDDYRYVVPASALAGALLLLVADTCARQIMAPHVMPVAVLTSFLGAPAFLWLLIRTVR